MQAAELVRDYIRAWNRRDPTGIVSLLGQNAFYFDVPVNKKLSGEALVQYLANDFRQRNFRYDLVGEILIGTSSIAFQYETCDVDKPANAAARISGAEFLTISTGQVTGIEDYYKLPNELWPDESSAKYRKSGLRAEQAEAYKQRLLHAMQTDRLYRVADLTLPDLARSMGCSINHLSQLINSEFDQSFYQFLNCYRIREAKALLSQQSAGRVPVAQVAAQVGFRSNSAFYAAFKRICQQTPSDYRRNHDRC